MVRYDWAHAACCLMYQTRRFRRMEGGLAANHLRVRFEQPDDAVGIPLEDVETTLHHVRMAVRETVWHLGGNHSKARRPPAWVVEQSALKVVAVSQGSLVIDLDLADQKEQPEIPVPGYGPQALGALLAWEGPGDPSLPLGAAEHLEKIAVGLSSDVVQVRLTDWDDRGDATIRRKDSPKRPLQRKREEPAKRAHAHGLLMEVNWRKRTAQLHPTRPFPGERHIPLRFEASLSDAMLRCATQFVAVSGTAHFNENDEYDLLRVDEVIPSKGNRQFTYEEFEEALAKTPTYDPEHDITASEPFDAMEFIRMIHDARDAS